jgi:hypothetical protein
VVKEGNPAPEQRRIIQWMEKKFHFQDDTLLRKRPALPGRHRSRILGEWALSALLRDRRPPHPSGTVALRHLSGTGALRHLSGMAPSGTSMEPACT